jgi:NAD(P)-dependent dehydrogenase (short-subunit alcohol dehydrogenase family)
MVPAVHLDGVAAIVTGGASGIGEASARAISALGGRCLLLDRNAELGEPLARELGGAFVQADVTDEDGVALAVETASELGPLRALVNAAGIGNAARTVDRNGDPMAFSLFEKVVRVNLFGTFNCLRLAAAAMAKVEPVDADGARGAIVNIASVAAFDGQIGQAAYSASKAGVVGMTLPIARDLASVGIRVNTIAPGFVDTPIFGKGERGQALKAHLGANVLFPKRPARADEVAELIVHLLTNDYINAETVRFDGGIRMPPK